MTSRSHNKPEDHQDNSSNPSHADSTILQLQKSPWQVFLSNEPGNSVGTAHVQATTDEQEQSLREKKWVSTPRASRAALMDHDEQDLIQKLTATNLSERERRQVTASVCRLDLERQARIFECVRAKSASSKK